jgi:hypothetical protein
MVHEPVHIVHLFTVHSVNFFEFQIIVIYKFIFLQISKLNIYLEYNIDLSYLFVIILALQKKK